MLRFICSRSFILLVLMFTLSACGGGGGDDGATSPKFSLSCDMGVTYTPAASPVLTTAGAATTTIIVLHGKNAAPTTMAMNTLAADLVAQGYDVSIPYMPWRQLDWDGTLCDAMSYVNSLITAEKNTGKNVILLGHSLGGSIVLSYAALSNTSKPDAVVVLAPGHFIHSSSVLKSEHAASIQSAREKVNAGLGDVVDTFQTYNGGTTYNLNTTPNIYLSYHDTGQFPNIKTSIPVVAEPVLWLAGLSDPLTTTAKNLGIYAAIPSGANYTYQEIAGDHLSLVSNVAPVLDPWYLGL